MKIQRQLILTVGIVHLGFISVQCQDQIEYQVRPSMVDDKGKIQKNFQSLFNAIARNDAEWNGIHSEILNQEVIRERQTFDTMNEELQIARDRNDRRKRNFYNGRNNAYENVTAIKRETNENNPSGTSFGEVTSTEDQFFNKYGNDVHESGVWEPFNRIKNSEPLLLMSVCNQAHQLAKLGPPAVNIFSFYAKTLKFMSKKYYPIDIDLVIYSVTLPNSTQIDPRCWFITKGLRSDCVYYLQRAGQSMEEFYLTDQHVCGIEFMVQRKK